VTLAAARRRVEEDLADVGHGVAEPALDVAGELLDRACVEPVLEVAQPSAPPPRAWRPTRRRLRKDLHDGDGRVGGQGDEDGLPLWHLRNMPGRWRF
jgi:hypothetical protein